MKPVIRNACLVLLSAVALGTVMTYAVATTPPIACRHARSAVEQDICGSPADLAIDREIAALYDRGLAEFAAADRHTLAQSQLKFLHARAGCDWATHHSAHPGAALSECVRTKMDERLRSLRRTVDQGGYGR